MVLRFLLHKLLNNPRVIDKLADSYPIRRAAQLTAYALQRFKALGGTDQAFKLSRFLASLRKELGHGFKAIKDNQKFKDK